MKDNIYVDRIKNGESPKSILKEIAHSLELELEDLSMSDEDRRRVEMMLYLNYKLREMSDDEIRKNLNISGNTRTFVKYPRNKS